MSPYLNPPLVHDGGEGVWQGWLGDSVGAGVLNRTIINIGVYVNKWSKLLVLDINYDNIADFSQVGCRTK